MLGQILQILDFAKCKLRCKNNFRSILIFLYAASCNAMYLYFIFQLDGKLKNSSFR